MNQMDMKLIEQGLKVWEVVSKKPDMVVFLVCMGLLGFSLYIILQMTQKK